MQELTLFYFLPHLSKTIIIMLSYTPELASHLQLLNNLLNQLIKNLLPLPPNYFLRVWTLTCLHLWKNTYKLLSSLPAGYIFHLNLNSRFFPNLNGFEIWRICLTFSTEELLWNRLFIYSVVDSQFARQGSRLVSSGKEQPRVTTLSNFPNPSSVRALWMNVPRYLRKYLRVTKGKSWWRRFKTTHFTSFI